MVQRQKKHPLDCQGWVSVETFIHFVLVPLSCYNVISSQKEINFIKMIECFVDRQLIGLGGHNYAVTAAYGEYGGVMGAVGCYNWQSFKCWKNWSYKTCGYKWEIKRGPLRYIGAVKKSGYKARPKTCATDTYVSW